MLHDPKPAELADHPLVAWSGPLGLPDFSRIEDAMFRPASMRPSPPTRRRQKRSHPRPRRPPSTNTLAVLELSGEALSRVSAVFWCKAGAHTNETIQAIEREVAPHMARHFSTLYMDERLFARIDALYRQRESLGLDPETDRVLEKTWKRFVRAGARLGAADKARLAEINEELAGLGARFGQNVLADESGWAHFLTKEDVEGLPDYLVDAMAEAAESRGRPGEYALTLSRSTVEPFLTLSPRRDLREILFRAFVGRGAGGGESDNRDIVRRTLELRAEKAKLLGYPSYAAFKLDDTMARRPRRSWSCSSRSGIRPAKRAAKDERALARIAAKGGRNHAIAPWDWRHYADKYRAERFAFDEAEIKPYLKLENVIAAAFDVAGRLFGLAFEEKPGIDAWHPDVRVFAVTDSAGAAVGTFLADYFNRPSKRSGAWASSLRPAYGLGEGSRPIIYNVMNFSKPPKGQPALLSFDEARTLFHEFGHALHGLLSDVTWPSVSGTSVSRDFVELPSQLFEHWLAVPEILEKYALHYRTGEPMPAELMKKVLAAQTADAGFATVEFTASALVDMAFHSATDVPDDVLRFEAETLSGLGMPDAIAMRHATPHFLHVFAGDGYSAGYYSYMWSEVLDADAFKAFEERGDPFDPDLAARLKQHIYAAGGSRDPEELYTAFRGRLPRAAAMLEKRGLAAKD